MSTTNNIHIDSTESTDSSCWSLYNIGGAAALIAALIFRRNLDAEYMLLRMIGVIKVGPSAPPSTVVNWFMLLQNNKLLGLTLLNLFDIVNYALVGLIFLALFAVLRRVSKSFMALVAALCFVGIAVYFASNQAFTMLTLSNQYVATTADSQRALLEAAGQAVLAIHNSANYLGSGVYISFFLVSIAGLITSGVMLRSKIFSKGTAYIGILANGFGLGYYIVLAIAPTLVFIPLSASAPILLIWYILVGLRLLKLGKTK